MIPICNQSLNLNLNIMIPLCVNTEFAPSNDVTWCNDYSYGTTGIEPESEYMIPVYN